MTVDGSDAVTGDGDDAATAGDDAATAGDDAATAAGRAPSDILAGIRGVLAEMGVDATVDLATDVAGDLELDSMRRIELAILIENRFRIALEPEDEARIATIGDLVDVIRHRLETRRDV